jgi:hypothetical protein
VDLIDTRKCLISNIRILIGVKVKPLFVGFLVSFSIIFYACGQPAPTQPTFSGKTTLNGFGVTFDSSYYKVWSDSSWETFNGDTTINGTTYIAIMASDSSEYLYDSLGYSGFVLPQIYGSEIIIFDAPLPSIPDTLTGGLTYVSQTTFSFQGTSYSLIDQENLVDTGTVQTPFGTFTGCPGIQSTQAITSGGAVIAGGDEVYWLAKGPSVVEQDLIDFGYSIVMEYGVVNGKGWGVSFPKVSLGTAHKYLDNGVMRKTTSSAYRDSSASIRPLAQPILRGINPAWRLRGREYR